MFGFNTRKVGNNAEELGAKYLSGLGYRILARNFTIRGGEIDLVAKDKDELVFIEVKARFNNQFGLAKQSITPWKLRALRKTALFYIQKVNWGNKSYRFDLLAIDFDEFNHKPIFELIKNITF